MKLKYSLLAMVYHDKRLERLLKWQKLHLMECATLTKTHPGRLFHLTEPNPSWPASAQRSFVAAQQIDNYLSGYLTYLMNADVRIHQGQSRKEDNEHGQGQKVLPFLLGMARDLALESAFEPPAPGEQTALDDIADGYATWPIRPGHRR